MSRTSKNYDGKESPVKHLREILPSILQDISSRAAKNPSQILAVWAEIIGPKMAPMTRAYLFEEGVLHVKVNNSTLYSLLQQHEKMKLLKALRTRFPEVAISNIVFRMD